MKIAVRYSSLLASGEVSLVTASMCLEGFRPAFVSASFTNASLVRVSRVVPDLDTTINSACARSTDARTAAASSGSTLLMNFASILKVLLAFAQFSNAIYKARGPRSLPPIPICTTVVNFSPASFTISPACTLLAKSAAFFCCAT